MEFLSLIHFDVNIISNHDQGVNLYFETYDMPRLPKIKTLKVQFSQHCVALRLRGPMHQLQQITASCELAFDDTIECPNLHRIEYLGTMQDSMREKLSNPVNYSRFNVFPK